MPKRVLPRCVASGEKDPEQKGEGNSYTTEFRQYDPRLGRWLSLDPLMMMFPEMSPYVAFGDNPIVYTDPYGLAPSTGGDDPKKSKDGGKASAGSGAASGVAGGQNQEGFLEGLLVDAKENTVIDIEEVVIYGQSRDGKKLATPTPQSDQIDQQREHAELLQTIAMKGILDAVTNAVECGFPNAFFGPSVDDYETTEEKIAYLSGRIAGDVAVGIAGGVEIDAGVGIAIGGLVTGPGEVIAAPVGGAIALHGSLVVWAASADAVEATAELNRLLSMNGGSGTESSGSSEAGEEQPVKKTAAEIGKNCKKMTENQIGQLLGDGWHKNGAKTKLIKKHLRELKGSTNADFYIEPNSGEILLKGNKSGAWVQTGLILE